MAAKSSDADVLTLPGGGRKFTKENAAEMARRSVASRQARVAREKRDLGALTALLKERRAQLPPRSELVGIAESALMMLLGDVALERWKPRTAAEAMNMARTLYEIVRLEGNQATSISATVTKEDAQKGIEDLRRLAADRLRLAPSADASMHRAPSPS